jgi:hypothetical protein
MTFFVKKSVLSRGRVRFGFFPKPEYRIFGPVWDPNIRRISNIYMLVFSILLLRASSGLFSADIVKTCLLHGKYYTVMALVVIQYIL